MKEDEIPGWAAPLGATIVCFLVIVMALVAAGGWNWFAKFLESAAPNWLQAVGALVAIAAAGHFSARQVSEMRKDADRARRRSDTERALAIWYILRRVNLVYENAQRALTSNNANTIKSAGEQVEMMQSALRGLPVFEIPSPRLVYDLQRVDRDLLYVQRLIREEVAPKNRNERRSGAALFQRVHRRVDAAIYACTTCIDYTQIKGIPLKGVGPIVEDEFDLDPRESHKV